LHGGVAAKAEVLTLIVRPLADNSSSAIVSDADEREGVVTALVLLALDCCTVCVGFNATQLAGVISTA